MTSSLPADVLALVNAELAEANAQVVARNGSMVWTRGELLELFNRVANADNWKLAIDATVSLANDHELFGMYEAVVFFAGCHATIRTAGGRNRYRVTAVGYYTAVGA